MKAAYIQYQDPSLIGQIKGMQRHIVEVAFNLKEEVLCKILKTCLDRDPNDESDFKRLNIILHEQYPGREFIGFDGNMIGEIKYYMIIEGDQIKYGYEFEPKTVIDK